MYENVENIIALSVIRLPLPQYHNFFPFFFKYKNDLFPFDLTWI